jgi:hypothetical protein
VTAIAGRERKKAKRVPTARQDKDDEIGALTDDACRPPLTEDEADQCQRMADVYMLGLL